MTELQKIELMIETFAYIPKEVYDSITELTLAEFRNPFCQSNYSNQKISIRKTKLGNQISYGIFKLNNSCLSKTRKKFFLQPLPDQMNEDFFMEFRFNSMVEALVFYKENIDNMEQIVFPFL